MIKKEWPTLIVLAALVTGGISFYRPAHAQRQPEHPSAGDGKDLVVQLCDGKTKVVVQGVGSNERLSPGQAQQVSDDLMKQWLAKQDPAVAARWASETAAGMRAQPGREAEGSAAGQDSGRNQASDQVANFSPREHAIWAREVSREVAQGDKIFHDDKLLGSTNGVSCAMCHPNGANTHPETYPKFQIQLQRVALLRDMINWCIEQPVRGKRLEPDDPKMRALEAYILWQRKGVPMAPGKH